MIHCTVKKLKIGGKRERKKDRERGASNRMRERVTEWERDRETKRDRETYQFKALVMKIGIEGKVCSIKI